VSCPTFNFALRSDEIFGYRDTRAERLIRLDIGKPWSLGPSLSTENAGHHTIRYTREVDLRALKHVTTRSSATYEVRLPPVGQASFNGELGLWFETEFGRSRGVGTKIIVKFLKKGSYAYNETKIYQGDELLKIDGARVSNMTFDEAMEKLKTRLLEVSVAKQADKPTSGGARARKILRGLSGARDDFLERMVGVEPIPPVVLTFRTVEERMRSVRLKAARSSIHESSKRRHGMEEVVYTEEELRTAVDVDIQARSLEPCDVPNVFCILESAIKPFQVKNQSANTTIYYRQKNCENYSWQTLQPGQSRSYTWEEPLKPKRLHVRASKAKLSLDQNNEKISSGRSVPASKSVRKIRDEEDFTFTSPVSFRLDEIGFTELIHLGSVSKRKDQQRAFLKGHVDVERSTRILILQDFSLDEVNNDQMEQHIQFLNVKVQNERTRLEELRRLESLLPEIESADAALAIVESSEKIAVEAQRIMADFSEEASHLRHDQVVVDVLQAKGLSLDTAVSVCECNPYVEVVLKTNQRRRFPFMNPHQRAFTYFVRRTHNPEWRGQSFVFDVPPAAVAVTRGHAVRLTIKNFRTLGRHQILGRVQIDLHTLRDQEPLEGWYPLAARTGHRELEQNVSHGSVFVRSQWIYSTRSLLRRFVRLSELRLAELQQSALGMATQLERKRRNETPKVPARGLRGFRSLLLSKKSSQSGAKPNTPKTAILNTRQDKETSQALSLAKSHSSEGQDSSLTFSPVELHRRRLHSSGDIVHRFLEQHRNKNMAMHSSVRRLQPIKQMDAGKERIGVDSVTFANDAFRSWINVQALSTRQAKLSLDQGKLQIQFEMAPATGADDCPLAGSMMIDTMSNCFHLPSWTAPFLRDTMHDYAFEFAKSRKSFERTATMTLTSALHQGGVLTIRPMTALNVSDGYNAMTLKVACGEEVFYSRTVDASVCASWNASTGSQGTEESSNDIQLRIPPQKNSGSIRVSIIGERSQQRMLSSVEVGHVVLPIFRTIAICSRRKGNYWYTKWFPLKKSEENRMGDDKSKPTECEQVSDNLFHDYFAPCVQLSLHWTPDKLREPELQALQASVKHGDHPLVKWYCSTSIRKLSLALVDSERAAEVLSLHLLGLGVTCLETKANTRASLALDWLQLDYQDEHSIEPVVLAPSPTQVLDPVIEFVVVKDNQRSIAEVTALDLIDISVSEFDVAIEENIIFDLYGLFNNVGESRRAKKRRDQGYKSGTNTLDISREWIDYPSSEPSSLLRMINEGTKSANTNAKLYVRELFLSGLKINLSYTKGRRQYSDLSSIVWPKEDSDYVDSAYRQPSEVFAAWSRNTTDEEFQKYLSGMSVQ
jgi:hypothetical protein